MKQLRARALLEAVFFDLGDTLVRADPTWADVYLRALEAYGLSVDGAQLEEALLAEAQGAAWTDIGPFEPSPEASFERVREYDRLVMARLGFDELPDDFYRSVGDAFRARASWHIFPDVVPALDALAAAGLRLGIISNWVWEAPELLHDLELAARFSAIVVSARVGYQKPHRAIFERALAELRVEPQRAIHVGDSYRADVVGARTVGIEPVLLDRGLPDPARLRDRVPDRELVIVSDLFELLDLVGVARPLEAEPAAG